MKQILLFLLVFSLVAVGGASAVFTDGLLGYYSFQTNWNYTNYTAGSGYNFTNTAGTIGSTNCKIGNCLVLDGTQGVGTNNLSAAMTNSLTTGTIAFFVNMDTNSVQYNLFSKGAAVDRSQVRIDGTTNTTYFQTNGGSTITQISESTTSTFLLVYTWNSTERAIWRNTTKIASSAGTYSLSSSGNLGLGQNQVNINERLAGSIDELYIFNRVLNSADISCIYNYNYSYCANVATSTNLSITATDAYTSAPITTFNATVTGTAEPISLLDKSGNGNDLTNNGATWNQSSDSYIFNGIDSTGNYMTYPFDINTSSTSSTYMIEFFANNKTSGAENYVIVDRATTNSFVFSIVPSTGRFSLTTWNSSGSTTGGSSSSIYSWGTTKQAIIILNNEENRNYVYVDGVLEINTSRINSGDSVSNAYIGRSIGATTRYFNGTIFNNNIWNRSLSASEVATVYANGTVSDGLVAWYDFNGYGTTNYTTTNGTINTDYTVNTTQTANITVTGSLYLESLYTNFNTSALSSVLYPWATIGAKNSYNNNSINNFTVQFNNTNYTTIVGSARVPVNTSASLTLYSSGYFNTTITPTSFSSIVNVSMNEAVVGFTADEIVTGTALTDFTVCAPLQCSTGNNPSLNLSAGVHTVQFNKTGWYSQNFTINVTALTSTIQNLSGVHQYKLNISLVNAGNNTRDPIFTANITSGLYNYSFTGSTTNTFLIVPWTNDTGINISLYDASFTATVSNLTNTSTFGVPTTANITIVSFYTNSFLITFRDESTGALITGTNITAYLTGTVISYNFTTNNGYINATLLSPQVYTISYGGTPYTSREYTVTLTNQTAQELTLWLLVNTSGTYIRFTVLDQTYQTLTGATINANKKNLSGINYFNVQDCTTDSNGECLMFLETFVTTYRFLTEYEDVTRLSGDTVLSRDTYTIVLNTGSSTLQNVLGRDDIVAALNFSSPGSFLYTVNDANNIANDGLLVIERRYGGRYYPVSSTTGSGSSFSISATGINTTLGDEIVAKGYVYIDGEPVLTHTISIIESPAGNALGSGLAFMFLGMAFTIIFIFAWNPVAPLVAFAAFIVIMSRIGLIAIGGGAVVAIIIVVGIAIYRMRSV